MTFVILLSNATIVTQNCIQNTVNKRIIKVLVLNFFKMKRVCLQFGNIM